MQELSPNHFFRSVFEGTPVPSLVVTPDFEIVAVNDRYLAATMTRRSAIIGRNLFEVFPDNPSVPDVQSVDALRSSLQRVLQTAEPDAMPVTRYDIPRHEPERGFEKRFWKPRNLPVLDQGRVAFIIHTVEDVTENRKMEVALEDQAGLLDYANVFATNTKGEIRFWNSGSAADFGYSRDEAIGRNCGDLLHTRFPEQPFDVILAGLRRTGEWSGELEYRVKGGRHIIVWSHWLLHRGWDGDEETIVHVNTDITERKRLETILMQRTEELERIDRRRNQFIAVLSHELRNPLAAISNAAPLLSENCNGNPVIRKIAGMLERPVAHLNRLVDDLLDVSRLTSGKLHLQEEMVEVAFTVRRAAHIVRPQIEACGQKLELSLPKGPLWVRGDVIRLEQVVVNLLSNASKYTQQYGMIWLSAARRGNEVVIRVADNGVGMSDEVLPKIFDLFSRGNDSMSADGLGVGLALVQQIVRLHGGRVEGHSDGPGKGSEFVVRLAAREAPVETDQSGQSGEVSRQRCILIVDDNKDAADGLSMLLSLQGHDVHVAYDGKTGLEIAEREQPDVIVLDIGMPEMDGYQVAEKLNRSLDLDKCVLIALTGYGQDRDRQRTREAGFRYHLTKPVDLESFLRLLDELPS